MKQRSKQSAWPRKLLVMTCLLALSTRAWAPAPIYFDLGGLILLVAGLLAAVVIGFAWLLARGAGVVVAVGLMLVGLVVLMAWGTWSGYRQNADSTAHRDFAHEACHARDLMKLPERSTSFRKVVLVLPGNLKLREEFSFKDEKPADDVEIAGVLPSVRSEDTAYVRITATLEDVPGTDDRQLRGFEVLVQDHSGTNIAALRDYYFGDWCSGTTPSVLVERFLRAATGLTVGLYMRERFDELLSSPYGSLAASIHPGERRQVRRLRASHAAVNSIKRADRQLTFKANRSDVRIEERDPAGRVVAVWHIRMPASFLSPKARAQLLRMELAEDTLSLEFGRERAQRQVWENDDDRNTATYTDITVARVKLDSRLLLPAIQKPMSADGQGAPP